LQDTSVPAERHKYFRKATQVLHTESTSVSEEREIEYIIIKKNNKIEEVATTSAIKL
jgi:hypothetical protein